MSPLSIASTLFSLFQAVQGGQGAQSTTSESAHVGSSKNADFASSLALRMASTQAQSVNSLINSAINGGKASTGLDFLTGGQAQATRASDALALLGIPATTPGLSEGGRNLSLFDPESAYRMMSVVNRKDVRYKAQFAELDAMGSAVAAMQQAAKTLAAGSTATDNEAIKAELQAFATKYNNWIARFDPAVGRDGVLAGTQAAEISLYELEQSVENIFNGASSGFHGLKDLGLTISPSTNLAALDVGTLDRALAGNRQGAIGTIREFAANFARSAELLTSTDNFIPNRLGNLDRAIDYISDNRSALQAEFGLGDPAPASAQIARALAAYNRVHGI